MLLPILLTICCVIIDQVFLAVMAKKQFGRAVMWKTLASLCFLGVGFCMAFLATASNPVHTKIFIGLVLGLIGDVLLAMAIKWREKHDLFFVIGAAFFAVGHVFYLMALFATGAKLLVALPFWLVMVGLSAWYTLKMESDAGSMLIPGACYIGLVAAVAAAACSRFVLHPNIGTALFAVGGVLFTISDNILSAHKMGKAKAEKYNRWVHYTYYAAQLMIGWSMLWS